MLGVVLVLEVVAVVAIDLGVLFSGRELVGRTFSPAEAMSGAPGLGLLFAFLGFFGFEATAVFRNEARDPDRTVPRATYVAVLGVGHVVMAFRHGLPAREADRAGPMLWIVGGLLLQMLLLKPLGFSVATGLLFAFAARGFGRGPLAMTVPIGIALSFAIWIVFAQLLKLSLPAGPLERRARETGHVAAPKYHDIVHPLPRPSGRASPQRCADYFSKRLSGSNIARPETAFQTRLNT